MKFKSIFLSAFILLIVSCTEKKETDIETLKLHGKIKSMRHFTYEAVDKFGEITQGEKVDNSDEDNFYRIFNNKGYVIEKQIFNIDGSVRIKRLFKFDDNNLRLGLEEYIFKIENYPEISVDTVAIVDTTTAVDTVSYYDPNYNSLSTVNKDIPAEPTVEYFPDGKLVFKAVYKYSNNNLTETYNYNDSSKIIFTTKSVFNKDNNEITKETYNQDGSFYSKRNYEYDDKHNIVKALEYSQDGIIMKTLSLSYDDNNNIIEWKIQNDKLSLLELEKYKYDKKNNMIEKTTYNIDGSIYHTFKYEYTYDNTGNWIKCIVYKDNKPLHIKVQEFEYYEK